MEKKFRKKKNFWVSDGSGVLFGVPEVLWSHGNSVESGLKLSRKMN